MALHVHRAERTDLLADGLAEVLADPLPDPFASEVVVVPAKGVERWLSQRLSHRLGAGAGEDGICAGIEFRNPWALVAEIAGTRDDDPWSPEALAWPLLSVIDASLEEPWAHTLATHLGEGMTGEERLLRQGRRYAVARRLAGHLASYAAQRPGVLTDWSAGHDTDGLGAPVPDDLAWQPHLWRRLTDAVGGPTPADRHAEVLHRLRTAPERFDLPVRLSLFGHTRLSVTDVELLRGLAEHRDVHLWLPHPSPVLWDALAAAGVDHPVRRRDDDSHLLAGHPLLAGLGRDLRELQRTLGATATPVVPVVDEGAPAPVTEPPGATLLGWLQADLRANAAPAVDVLASRVLDADDRSVQVHAAHGPARQVEVLREVLLGLLADDTSLEPRDILVMCPDIEAYAPLISAGFGLGDVVGETGHPAHGLRVRLADRSLVQTNALLTVGIRLLDLAGGRAEASEVLDLAHADPVRRRFGFSDDDLEQATAWVTEAGVRWAFDAEHRAGFGLQDYVQNTWRFGVDRILAGVTMSDDTGAWLDRTLPLDDVGSSQIDLAGRLAEYVDRLCAATDRLIHEQPLSDWLDALAEGIASLADVGPGDAWQPGQVQRELGRVAEEAGGLADSRLRLTDVRSLLERRLAGRPTRANFRTGTLTVCTMVPMRSVPHRVVCLLGLDDGVFPRLGIADGDDLLAREPVTGERDVRSEDRQLFLDAILAARQTLVVCYTGADPLSGARRPPATPLGELLDALDVTATVGAEQEPGTRVRDVVTVVHPLQPFDIRNVRPGALAGAGPFSFDPAALAGAEAARGSRTPVARFLPVPLPDVAGDDVSLDDLLGFFRHPVRGFLRHRLDIALPQDEEPVSDAIPVEIDNLQEWQVADRLLRDLLDGAHPDHAVNAEWRRGLLPPGRLGWRHLQELATKVRPIAAEALALRSAGGEPRAIDVDVDLGDGRRLRGTVAEVFGTRLVPVSYSRLGATHRLQSWLRLLALTASDDDHNWTAHTVGRPANSHSHDAFTTSLLGPLDHTAVDTLRRLVALRDRGLTEPLPLPVKASFEYAKVRRTQGRVEEAMRKAGWKWETDRFPGEDADAAHVRVWGAGAELPGADAPLADEQVAGERHRFGCLALVLWGPLLDAEQGSW